MSENGNDQNGKLGERTLRVRMYRVGFGDCFLLSVPVVKEGKRVHRHFVVDCGVHGRGNIGTIERAVDNIAEVTDKKLAAIIATHSHQDHISGFSEKFCSFDIEEVWLPWCENQLDELAIKWQRKEAALVERLDRHFTAQAKIGDAAANTTERKSALSAVANLVRNKKAMQLLRSGFGTGAKVRYLEAGKTLSSPADAPGLTVRFLGPPRDEKFLAKMHPPVDQRYLQLDASGTAGEMQNLLEPFPSKWRVDAEEMKIYPHRLAEAEEKALQEQLSDSSLNSLAFALDHVKNNTSLVALFMIRGQYLLFPGDAEYGNWRYWLDEEEAEEILPRITFLKVGHHGSFNATPRAALEKMSEGEFAAMVSTQSTPWESIPRVPLMERLDERTRQKIVRSDWIDVPNAPPPLAGALPQMPANFAKEFKRGEFWFDYEIEL
jgi:beta-lactamase superfamily II metal-dependent hydrolase